MRSGAISVSPLPLDKAIQLIKSQSLHRYDPIVVDHFLALASDKDPLLAEKTRELKSRELEVGMQLADDLRSDEGVLLIVKDTILTASNIGQIRRFEQLDGSTLVITIMQHEVRK